MLFRSRYEKQLQRIKEQTKDGDHVYDVEDVRNVLEKGDVPAMIISALITILPVALVFLLAISALGFFFVAR